MNAGPLSSMIVSIAAIICTCIAVFFSEYQTCLRIYAPFLEPDRGAHLRCATQE